MALIKFLLIAILVLWVIRLLFRVLFPVLLANLFGKMQEQAQQGAHYQPGRGSSRRPEGAISIDHIPAKKTKGNPDKLGDFVDFEEVK